MPGDALVCGGLAELVPDSVVACDADGVIRHWNGGAERLFGWRADQAVGRAIDDLLATRHPFGLQFIADERVANGHWEGELFRRTADGRELHLSTRQHLQHDATGRTVGILEWARESRQVSEGEIAAHRFSNLFNAMAAAFWELDFSEVRKAVAGLVAAGETDIAGYLRRDRAFIDRAIPMVRVIDVNEKALDMYGIPSRAAALSRPMDWAWPPESRFVFAESLVAAAERRDSFSMETTFTRWDGARIDGLFTVCWPTDHKARGTVLVGVIDITDRKRAFQELEESEERYRTLFKHMPVALLQLDMQPLYRRLAELERAGVGDLAAYVEDVPAFVDEVLMLPQIEEANVEGLRLLGAGSIEELRGPIFWAWKERPDTIRRSLAARLRGAPQYSEETVITRPDGTPVDVLYTMAFPPALMERGFNVVGLVDISERKKASQALRDSEERLRAVQAEFSHASRVSTLGELTASIAHEVNQPLAAIIASGQASLRWLDRPEPALDEVVALAADIVADARRASEIIARIRGMALKRGPDPRALELNATIEEALLVVRHEALGRNVQIDTCFAEGLPEVTGDRVQLQQVVVNLALNAIQAIAVADCGDRRVTVSTARGGEGTVVFAVRDSGPGIAPENLAHLFAGFFTTKENGMGMGLAICRSIIQSHGGTIAAENMDCGACFRVTLPVAGA